MPYHVEQPRGKERSLWKHFLPSHFLVHVMGRGSWRVGQQTGKGSRTQITCSDHSSFCSAPSDGHSSRQQGASTSTPSDWLSLLAKAHGIGWARGGRSKGWPMAEAAELPFSCWVTSSVSGPASSEGFGGLLEGGDDDRVCGLVVVTFFTPLAFAGISLPLPCPAPTDTTCMLNPPLPRIGLFPAHWPTTIPAISNLPPWGGMD